MLLHNDSFKVYHTDVGLLCSTCGIPAEKILHGDAALIVLKGLTENYVATALVCDGYVPY